jgi:hypothetical protein
MLLLGAAVTGLSVCVWCLIQSKKHSGHR